jgi:DNA-directed RNA polymerase subunit RPC12/RpoP
MSRTDIAIRCPYCHEKIWMEFYEEEGEQQEMIIDCEVCCSPILYRVSFTPGSQARPQVLAERAQ